MKKAFGSQTQTLTEDGYLQCIVLPCLFYSIRIHYSPRCSFFLLLFFPRFWFLLVFRMRCPGPAVPGWNQDCYYRYVL